MAPKKKLQTAKQKRALAIAKKPITAPRKKKAVKRESRVNLPQPAFVSAIWGGETPDGRSAVHISVDPGAHVERLVLTVNGRGVWEGQP